MNLSRLEIYGFKSFGSKSVLEFKTNNKCSNVAAIVGPNGSGKSNVADAIRWVLGEQSTNVLRSKKGDDVIFSGSTTKSRSSYAEATICLSSDTPVEVEFNNKKHNLHEIDITRKLYRTGDSEYQINHKKVRLLDVQELLSSLGFGQSTYTVIGQGVVDRLLFFNATERKVLFDEAAGVRQYKIKREQAMRKLLSTDENLVRLNDILNELEPRVVNLRRLVKRAESRKDIEQELAENESQYYGSSRLELTDKLDRLNLDKNKYLKKIKDLRGKIQNLEKDTSNGDYIKDIEKKEGDIRQEIDSILENRDDLIRSIAYIQGQINQVTSRQSASFHKQESLEREKEDISKKIIFLETKVKEYRAEHQNIIKNKKSVEEKIRVTEDKMEKLESNPKTNPTKKDKKKLEEVRAELVGLEKERSELTNKLYYIKEENRLLKVRLEQEEMIQNRLKIEIKSISENINNLEFKKKELIDSGNETKIKVIEKTESIKKITSSIGKIENHLIELSSRVEQEKIDKLDLAIQELERDHAEIKQLVSRAKTQEQISTLNKIFNKFSEKLNLLIGQVGIFAKAVNPSERERIEREIKKLRDRLTLETKELSVLEIAFGRISSEIESQNRQILHQSEALKEKKTELKNTNTEADVIDMVQADNIQKQLNNINTKLEQLKVSEKSLATNENEQKNLYLTEKNELQKIISVLNSELYDINLSLTKKINIVENQERELEYSRNRLLEVMALLREISQPKETDNTKNSEELENKKQELVRIEKQLESAKDRLSEVIIQKRQFSESALFNEREVHSLENNISEFNQLIAQIDLEQARLSTKYEDLEEEMSRSNVTIANASNIKIIDQSVKDVLRARIENLRRKKDSIGGVDPETLKEYEELTTRSNEMRQQVDDLTGAKNDLEHIINELDGRIKQKFTNTFKEIANQFSHYFVTLFSGGKADLKLGEDEDGNMGVEITANPPGKRLQSLNVLSGGERTLTSLALLFAILSVNPSPFCVLDEVDAALDESNTLRFIKILKDLAKKTQFVVISHNRETMSAADLLYGITMNENHISKLISVKLEEAKSMSK